MGVEGVDGDDSLSFPTKQMFSCNQCDKMFEMRIKLNRHITNSHKSDDDFDFTKPGIELTGDQKAKYFDQLQTMYKSLREKLLAKQTILENRKKADVTQRKSGSIRTKKKVKVEKEFFREPTNLHNLVLPAGWKIKTFEKGQTSICSPSGGSFRSVPGALRHLVQSPKDPEIDVAIASFKSHLLNEGWHPDSSLPAGWLTRTYKGWTKDRRNSWTKQHYLTPKFNLLKGQEEVVRWLRCSGAEEKEVMAALGPEWLPHPRLSRNWLFRTDQNGTKRFFIRS